MKLAKIAKLFALLICLALLGGMLTACNDNEDPDDNGIPAEGTENTQGTPVADGDTFSLPEGFVGVDFSNGNIDFIANHYKPFGTSPDVKVELGQFRGAPAAKIIPVGRTQPWVAVDVASLLGSNASNVASVQVFLGAEQDDGKFNAVEGQLLAYRSTDLREIGRDTWSVFSPRTKTNTLSLDLDSSYVNDDYGFLVIRRTNDGAFSSRLELIDPDDPLDDTLDPIEDKEAIEADVRAKTRTVLLGSPANLYILGIGFLDSDGNYIAVDAGASFSAPDDFNIAKTRIIELGISREREDHLGDCPETGLPLIMNNRNNDNQIGWLTDGVDGTDSPYMAEDMRAAFELVVEFAEPPVGDIEIIWLGNSNNWTWHQRVVNPEGDIGTDRLVINLMEMDDFDKFQIGEQIKLYLGYFGIPCSDPHDGIRVRDCELCDRDGMEVPMTVLDMGITRAYLVIYE